MDKQEPDVDPYFKELMSEKTYENTKKAISIYLGLYLSPKEMLDIVFVNSSFFFDDLQHEQEYIPEGGKTIIDVSFINDGYDNPKALLHTILLFCMVFSYLRDHPNDRRFIRSSISKGSMHEISSCFFGDMFRMSSAARVKIIYIPVDLHAIYNTELASPEDIQIIKRKNDSIILLSNKYKFEVKHTYQKDEYDDLPQTQLEEVISKWDIDTVIKIYKSGTKKWMTNKAFSSTIDWTNDGFVYALLEGSDDLVEEFIKRDINKVLEIISLGKDIKFDSEYYEDNVRNEYDIPIHALKRNNKKIDNIYVGENIYVSHLFVMASANRIDMLLGVPIKKVMIKKRIKDNSAALLRDFYRMTNYNLIEKGELVLLKKLFVKYWPLVENVVWEGDLTKFKRSIIEDIKREVADYKLRDKIDQSVANEWLEFLNLLI